MLRCIMKQGQVSVARNRRQTFFKLSLVSFIVFHFSPPFFFLNLANGLNSEFLPMLIASSTVSGRVSPVVSGSMKAVAPANKATEPMMMMGIGGQKVVRPPNNRETIPPTRPKVLMAPRAVFLRKILHN